MGTYEYYFSPGTAYTIIQFHWSADRERWISDYVRDVKAEARVLPDNHPNKLGNFPKKAEAHHGGNDCKTDQGNG